MPLLPENAPPKRLLRLRRGVLRRLQNAVTSRLGPPSAELRAYERDYRREGRADMVRVEPADVERAAANADLAIVGDFHSFPPAQAGCRRLLEAMAGGSRPVALFVELVRTRDQPHLDAYLRGELGEVELLRRLDYGRSWGFPWAGYRTVLETARVLGIPVLGMNGPGAAERASLARRDRWAAKVIARFRSRHPDVRVLVMAGDLHLSRSHLPQAILAENRPKEPAPSLIRVMQNHDDLYWKFGGEQGAVRLDADTFCLFTGSPWEKLDSYLTWLDSGPAAGPESLPWSCELDAPERVLEPARALARFLGLRALPGDISIFTPDDLSFTASLRHDGDSAAIIEQALGSDVFVLPDGKGLFLARLDLAHAAEAAAELLARGDCGLDGQGCEPFFTRVRRRALSWFASKLLVPGRVPPSEGQAKSCALVSYYARRLRDDGYSDGDDDRWATLAAEDDLRLHLRVSLAVGREIGESLYHAFATDAMSLDEIREAFLKPPARGDARREVIRLHRLGAAPPISSSEPSLAPAK